MLLDAQMTLRSPVISSLAFGCITVVSFAVWDFAHFVNMPGHVT
jgi:general stress protein CsbA